MIGYLSGKITHLNHDSLILNVNQVGYLVKIPLRLFKQLSPNSELNLFIHTHVKEDILDLFGFDRQTDLKMFQSLIQVSGVGPKIALQILSEHQASQIQLALFNADVDFFNEIPGIGKKTAQRLIVDLKDKLKNSAELDLSDKNIKQNKDLYQALISLGFNTNEIKTFIIQVDPQAKLGDQIKQCLQLLHQH